MKKVRLIRQEGKASLVQHMHTRVTVPSSCVVGGQCTDEVLAAGIPWGEAWDEIITINLTPGTVADRLRRFEAWTWQDLFENPLKAQQAFMSAIGPDIQNFMRAIKGAKDDR